MKIDSITRPYSFELETIIGDDKMETNQVNALAEFKNFFNGEYHHISHAKRDPDGIKRIDVDKLLSILQEDYYIEYDPRKTIENAFEMTGNETQTKQGKIIKRLMRTGLIPAKITIQKDIYPDMLTVGKKYFDGDIPDIPSLIAQFREIFAKLDDEYKRRLNNACDILLETPNAKNGQLEYEIKHERAEDWQQAVKYILRMITQIADFYTFHIYKSVDVDTAGLLGDVISKCETTDSQTYDYYLSITGNLCWDNDGNESTNFGHSGSCWFDMYSDSTPTFFKSGNGIGLLWHTDDDDATRGNARLWVAPIPDNPNWLVCFNQYSSTGRIKIANSARMIADILETQTGIGFTTTSIVFSVRGSTTIPYINTLSNGNNSYLIYPKNSEKIESGYKLDVNWKRRYSDESDFADCDPDNEDYQYCQRCDDRISEDDAHYVPDIGYYCEDCFNEYYRVCYNCRDVVSVDNSYTPENYDYHTYCESCYSDLFAYCESCESDVASSEINSIEIDNETVYICDDCLHDKVANCADCDSLIWVEDAKTIDSEPAIDPETGIILDTYHPNNAEMQLDDNAQYCESCYNRRLTDPDNNRQHYNNPLQINLFFIYQFNSHPIAAPNFRL